MKFPQLILDAFFCIVLTFLFWIRGIEVLHTLTFFPIPFFLNWVPICPKRLKIDKRGFSTTLNAFIRIKKAHNGSLRLWILFFNIDKNSIKFNAWRNLTDLITNMDTKKFSDVHVRVYTSIFEIIEYFCSALKELMSILKFRIIGYLSIRKSVLAIRKSF